MKWKTGTAVLLGAALLTTGVFNALDPSQNRTVEDQTRARQEQQVGDLSDAQERQIEQFREHGNSHADAENKRKLIPGELRPPELKPRMPIRLP